jgi:predicted nuclease of restriction endonuclease-like (RecB) superfamily
MDEEMMQVQKVVKKQELEKKGREGLEGYTEILQDIKSLLEKARYKAYKAVDNLKVQTYWQIGERIVRGELQHRERADYGERVIERLASDLDIAKRNLHNTVRFYRVYPIVQTVSAQLSWSNFVELIYLDNKEERRFYEQQAIQNAWSVRELRRQIRSNLYERMKIKGEVVIAPITKIVEPEQVFKDIYSFDFLKLPEKYTEDDLKTALLNKLENFLQELGSDFFIGRREVPVLIGGNWDKVDLELFHAGLLCYVLVEIKTEPFKHAHVSQMYSYLNWYKEHKWQEGQRQPIGLIICKTKDEETVHYALGDLKREIFVAEYKVQLPSEEEIKRRIMGLEE